jgi:hypothetical protein
MDWLPGLLKHLSISKSVTGAIFVTSATLYGGPRVIPTYVEPVPKDWSAVLVGALVFSGSLLLFWAVAGAWRMVRRGANAATMALAASTLERNEEGFLAVLGMNPNTPFHLDNVDYAQAPFTKLEVLELAESLSKKGLVRISDFNDDLVRLTSEGRKRALEIQRQLRGSDAVK